MTVTWSTGTYVADHMTVTWLLDACKSVFLTAKWQLCRLLITWLPHSEYTFHMIITWFSHDSHIQEHWEDGYVKLCVPTSLPELKDRPPDFYKRMKYNSWGAYVSVCSCHGKRAAIVKHGMVGMLSYYPPSISRPWWIMPKASRTMLCQQFLEMLCDSIEKG